MSADVTTGEYEPPWLEALGHTDPKQAQRFRADPVSTTKLDRLLANVATVEDKLAIVRMALEAGMDPNDPLVTMIITATRIQRVMNNDFEKTIGDLVETIRKADDAIEAIEAVFGGLEGTTKTQIGEIRRELRETTKLSIKGIEKSAAEMLAGHSRQREELSTVVSEAKNALAAVTRQLADFPQFTAALVTRLGEGIKSDAAVAVNEHAKTYASGKIELETKGGMEIVKTGIENLAGEISGFREQIRPMRETIERAKRDEEVLLFGIKMRAREYTSLAFGAVCGLIVGLLGMGTLASLLHIGFDPQTLADVRAGRVYAGVYPLLSNACKTEITSDLAGRGTERGGR
jgi:hypothetical protein